MGVNSARKRPKSPMDVMEGMTPKAILRPLMRLSVQSFKTGGWAAAVSRPSFQARSRRLPSSLGTVAFSLVKYVSGMAERGQMRATTRRKVMDTVEKPVAMMGRHGLNHTITRSRNRQWSKFAPSAAVLDHHVMFLASAHKETSLRSSSTTKKTCLLQRSIKWLLGPRLGKTDRCCASSSKGKDRTKDVPATAIVLSTFQKDPLLTKLEYKIRAQNRTYLYVWFWTFLMFFCLAIYFLIFFSSNCFL